MFVSVLKRVMKIITSNCRRGVLFNNFETVKTRFSSTAPSNGCSSNIQKIHNIPSPVGLPFIGTALSLMAAGSGSKIHKYIDRRHKELGSIFRDSVGPVNAVFTSDPVTMRSIFNQEGKYPSHIIPESWLLYNNQHDCKRGLLFMEGEEWLETRRVMNKLVLRPATQEWGEDPTSLVVDNLVADWKNRSSKGGFEPDIEKDLYRLSLDVIFSLMLGSAYQASSGKFLELVFRFSEAVHGIMLQSSKMTMLPATFYQKFNLSAWKEFSVYVGKSLKYGEKMVDQIYELHDMGDGLVSRMIAEGMDKVMVTRVLIDFIIAAGDTTAFSTQWSLYLLSRHPEIIHEFQSLERSPVEEQTYLRGIIKETLRLYPAAAFLTRFLPADSLVSDFLLPAGTLCIMSLYTSGRDAQYFTQPLKFEPKRWTKQNSDIKGVLAPYATIPFAMGARSCIGRKIAMTQMKEVISKVLKNFNLQLLNTREVDDEMQMILKPKDKIRIFITSK